MLGSFGWRRFQPSGPVSPMIVAEQAQPALTETPTATPQTASPSPAAQPTPKAAAGAATEKAAAPPQPAPPAQPNLAPQPAQTAAAQPNPADASKTATPSPAPAASDKKPVTPSFDVVRVEPSGESVIAGRAAPGATVDLLSNGSNLARAIADPSGLFAFVPPPLSGGSHEIALQTIAPDGTRARSAQSVTVVVPPAHDATPLVAVTTPGQPTVVLSRPDDKAAPTDGKVANAAPAAPAPPGSPAAPSSGPASPAAAPAQNAAKPAPPAPRANVTIATVEAEGTGRLFVSGSAAPGATLRLYLNDSFVAPGGTGPQGQVSFTIEKGIRPGDYQVRLDDVDPVSGAVRSRAEVPFSVPAPLNVATAEPGDGLPVPAAAAPMPPPASPHQAPRRNSVARAFPPAPTEGSTGAGPSPVPASPADTSPPSHTTPSPGPGFASRQNEVGAVVVPEVTTAIVSRGDNLWGISKRTYGRGTRYTVIYGANLPQIRNPSLIYPGQVFVLPPSENQAAH